MYIYIYIQWQPNVDFTASAGQDIPVCRGDNVMDVERDVGRSLMQQSAGDSAMVVDSPLGGASSMNHASRILKKRSFTAQVGSLHFSCVCMHVYQRRVVCVCVYACTGDHERASTYIHTRFKVQGSYTHIKCSAGIMNALTYIHTYIHAYIYSLQLACKGSGWHAGGQ